MKKLDWRDSSSLLRNRQVLLEAMLFVLKAQDSAVRFGVHRVPLVTSPASICRSPR